MNERLPNVPLVKHAFVPVQDAEVVVYQADVGTAAAVPLMVSHTRVVPAIRWPQPVVRPAGWQSSPPGIPPWNISIGRTKDCKSPVQGPRLDVHVAPEAVQLNTQRLRPPLLFPSKTRRLPTSSPSLVPP